jgi:multidrug efflux system membrane fusion protein
MAVAAVGLAVPLVGCSSQASQVSGPAAAPVVAALAERRDVPHELVAIGGVEAYSTVSVKTQVTGELTGVFFKEGDDVKKGQLLFKLDQRQAEAAIRRAEGTLAHDLAQAENDRAQARRYEALWKDGVASKEQYELVVSAADAQEAAVRADHGAVEDAKVQLTYCTISSPINGRTGNLIVHQGNMVKANDVPALVNINQVQPIYVTFTVPEKFLPEIRNRLRGGNPQVQALAPNDAGAPARGTLSFVDNGVDATTGTIKLKAQFVNAERRLWPGQFVNVTMNLGTDKNAVVVPSQAVQTGQQGQFVYVIKPDLTADVRAIVPGETDRGLTVVKQGIEVGERVVTDGQLRLAPGLRVQIKSGPGSSGGTEAARQPGTAGGGL